MKKILSKTLTVVSIIIALSANEIAIGQDALYEVQGLVSRNSIIREYKENVYVVYNEGSGLHSFNLVDLSSYTVTSLDVFILAVTDFEIHGDMVYFCGSASSPLIGWFDITTAFSGATPVYFGYLPSLNCSNYPTQWDSFSDVKKIEVMEIGGSIHLLIVGSATCTSVSGYQDRYFADVFFDGTGWKIEATLDHAGIFYYDDVAESNNYVVPVGHKNFANGEYSYTLPKPSTPYTGLFSSISSSPIPSYTIYAYAGYSCHEVNAASEYIIEHITDDILATACYGKIIPAGGSNYVYGTIFTLYDGATAVYSRYCVYPYNFIYRDLRYNPNTNSVYLLPGTGSTVPHDYLEFLLDPTHTSVTNILVHSDLTATKYNSLDACIHSFGFGQSILSGNDKFLRLWRHRLTEFEECHTSYFPSFDIENCNQIGDFWLDIYYDSGVVPINTMSPNISVFNISKICIDDEK